MQEMNELKRYLKPLYKHNTERISHEWFQKAQAGDEKYRKYFIVQQEY